MILQRIPMWRFRAVAAASSLLFAAAVLSCGGSTATDSVAPVAPGRTATVVVTPSASSLAIGTKLALQAHAQDPSGQVVPDASIFWSSSDTTIATVSSAGVVTARAPGTAQIAASAGGQSAVATLTVIPVPVASLAVVPGTGTVTVGSRIGLTAVAYDANGGSLTGRQVVWASAVPGVATVDAAGVVTGIAAGTATITATSEGKSGSAAITVTLVSVASVSLSPGSVSLTVGQTAALAVTAHDGAGNALAGRGLTWESANTAVATVAGSGLITAVGAGTTTITVTSEGRSATAQIVVSTPPPGQPAPPAPVASIIITPGSAGVTVGGGVTFSATTLDANSTTLSGRTVTWVSSAPQIASVDGSGTVTGVSAGVATITAASESRTATAQITVSAPPPAPPVPVDSVSVTPGSASLMVGNTTILSAAARSSSGSVLSGRVVSWASNAPQVATVSNDGVVMAVGAGSATITATSEGKSGSAVITVNPQPPAAVDSVSVTPRSAALTTGGSVSISATVRDRQGNQLNGRSVTWLSSAPQVASIQASGATVTVTAGAAGTATITATSEGRNATAQITVSAPPPAPVATVTVSPATSTLAVGGTVSLAATTRDGSNNILTGRAVTWASLNPGIATVSTTCVVSAVATGTATITATSEGRSGTATVDVRHGNAPPKP